MNVLTPRSELLTMLTFRRPYLSWSERRFIERYIASLPHATVDTFGNWHVIVGENPCVLWSAHTDTVHRTDGIQTVSYDADTAIVRLSKRAIRMGSSCLGADDTAGCFVLRRLILADVPGHYVFHAGEERGGIGSRALVNAAPDWLTGIRFAVALDRRGTTNVITEQYGGMCASDTFAASLAAQLNAHGFAYAPDNSGVYTDTAEYVDHVAECTNLSVGYEHEHSTHETLDVDHVCRLTVALAAVDWTSIACDRTPGDTGYVYTSWRDVSDSDAGSWFGYDRTTSDCNAACFNCGEPYVVELSTADTPAFYCCASCEDSVDARYQMRRERDRLDSTRTDDHNLYLTDEYAKVQAALAESAAALTRPTPPTPLLRLVKHTKGSR